MVRPKAVGKAKRINITSKQKVFGISSKTILDSFRHQFDNSHKYARLYVVPDKERPRVVIKANTHSGSQILFEVKTYNNNLQFEPVGVFDEGFGHRLIRDKSLRGKGLGSKALASERALKRAKGRPQAAVKTDQKSTLMLLLKNGYKINKAASAGAMVATGIRTEKELIEFLKKKREADPILEEFRLEKP